MKKILQTSGLAVLLLAGCDKVKNPVQAEQVFESNRKILLEDYTGHQCGNCPGAAVIAEQLYESYPNNVVPIAVHAGFFARLTPPKYVTSYTCTVGNDWDGASGGFGISAVGNPNGLVNRADYLNTGSLIQNPSKWTSCVSKGLSAPDYLDLILTTTYNKTTLMLNTNVKAKFKKSYPTNTKLCVVFLEDSVIGEQKDYSAPPGQQDIPDYVFMHMLRGSINGSWGALLKKAPIKYQDSVTVDYKDFAIDTAKFKPKHISVVAFVYNEQTREVLEVEKSHIWH